MYFHFFFIFLTSVNILRPPLVLVRIPLGPDAVITTLLLYSASTSVAFGLRSAVSGFRWPT